jgi:hypothetical protein
MKTCAGCGTPLVKRHQVRFCSNACQRAVERDEKIRVWLDTGVASTIAGSRRHYIRLYLHQEQSGRCAVCGGPDTWCGAPLAFVLDHIDGDASHNQRENLRLVCPNCDSQLPTFKARNRGRGRAWRRDRYAAGASY